MTRAHPRIAAPTNTLREPLRTALLIQDLEFGGTQRYALNLIKHLNRTAFAPELWVLRGGMEMVSLAREGGIAPIRISRGRRVGTVALARLARRLCLHRPHILYTLTVVPNIWGRLLGRVARVPVIVSGWRSLFPRQHERVLWRMSDRLICNAAVLKRIMVETCGVNPDRISIVPNGVDTEFFTPRHREESDFPLLLYVGRLVPEKNPMALLEAFRTLLPLFPSARLLMIGDGPLQGRIKSFILERQLQPRVTLVKGAPDIRPAMAEAWVLAMSSSREACPNVILEAMASGLPVVAPGVGGIPELVVHEKTGFLFEPSRIDSLAEHLIALLRDETLRRSMAARARERAVDRFSLHRMIGETERALLEAVQDTNRRRGRV